jgi:Domain of unknown function (DUF6265)
MPIPVRSALALVAVVLAAGPPAGAGKEPVPPLSTLAFMAGCWRGPAGTGAVIEEYYTAPAQNLMLGVTRFLRGDEATGFEFTSIERNDTAIIVTPRPDGQAAVPFRVTRAGNDAVTWENPTHDFPRLIAYRLAGGDTLVARIEGPGPEGVRSQEWRMTRARCAGR